MLVPQYEAAEVARRLGGTADWRALLRHSTRHSVRQALALGTLERIGRGMYSLPGISPARQSAASLRGLVSHRSAADHWLIERLSSEPVTEIVVPRRARPLVSKGLILHYADVPARDDHGGVTSPLRTVLDCAAILSFAEGLAIADSALRRRLIEPPELMAAALNRRGPGRRAVLRVAEAADGRAANPFESGLRAVLVEGGITQFVPQYQVRIGDFSARVDLGDPVSRVALEADSFAFHGSRQALGQDCRRYDELVRGGWLVLRFTWEDVMFDQEWVFAVVRETRQLLPRTRRMRP